MCSFLEVIPEDPSGAIGRQEEGGKTAHERCYLQVTIMGSWGMSSGELWG